MGALNERFNNEAVEFMQKLFTEMILNQNEILKKHRNNLNFKRILLNDATGYSLPNKFCDEYKGSGGSSSKSAIKIQLQYDLLSGSFLCCDFFSGTVTDSSYLELMDAQTRPGDFRLADLGYYKIDYLKEIDSINIAKVKNVKIERFKCFLYRRLLSLLLASQIVFTSKDIIYEESDKEVSILKSFSLVNEYFITLKADVFRNEFKKILFFYNILNTVRKLGIKCKKKSKKTVDSILNFLKIKECELEKLSI